jgi:4-hydroxybenzoate polyprenyltransferase
MSKFINLLKLVRIHQISKNIFVFLPIFFSKNLFEIDKLILTILAALWFYFASAFVYVLNDLVDIESDKLHPIKRYRPLAAGIFSRRDALLFMLILFLFNILFVLFWFNNIFLFFAILFFFANNFIYNFIGKKIAYLDILHNSFGYVLRVCAGAFAIGVMPTPFLLVITFIATLLISLSKRIIEMRFIGNLSRKTLQYYDLNFSTKLFLVLLILLNLIYIIYTFTTHDQPRSIVLTIPMILILTISFYNDTLHSTIHNDDPIVMFFNKKTNLILVVLLFLTLLFLIYV